MKRVHEYGSLEGDIALADERGNELILVAPAECERVDCGYDHFWLIPEDELADTVTKAVEDTLRRLGLSGQVVA